MVNDLDVGQEEEKQEETEEDGERVRVCGGGGSVPGNHAHQDPDNGLHRP